MANESDPSPPPGKTPGQPEPERVRLETLELDAAVRDVPDVAERAASIGAVDVPVGKTPGQVAYEAWIGSISGNPMPWQYVESKHAWEAAAKAVREGGKTVGELTGESCSMCGRAKTWHPDCPTCRRIDQLESKLALAQQQVEAMQRELRKAIGGDGTLDLRPSILTSAQRCQEVGNRTRHAVAVADCDHCHLCHAASSIRKLVAAIEAALAAHPQAASQWIPCSERMPDISEFYLGWLVGEGVNIHYFDWKRQAWGLDRKAPSHWQPMPSPAPAEGGMDG